MAEMKQQMEQSLKEKNYQEDNHLFRRNWRSNSEKLDEDDDFDFDFGRMSQDGLKTDGSEAENNTMDFLLSDLKTNDEWNLTAAVVINEVNAEQALGSTIPQFLELYFTEHCLFKKAIVNESQGPSLTNYYGFVIKWNGTLNENMSEPFWFWDSFSHEFLPVVAASFNFTASLFKNDSAFFTIGRKAVGFDPDFEINSTAEEQVKVYIFLCMSWMCASASPGDAGTGLHSSGRATIELSGCITLGTTIGNEKKNGIITPKFKFQYPVYYILNHLVQKPHRTT